MSPCSLCACWGAFFFNDTATTEIYTLSLHDALPIGQHDVLVVGPLAHVNVAAAQAQRHLDGSLLVLEAVAGQVQVQPLRADLFAVGSDEAKPDLRVVTR